MSAVSISQLCVDYGTVAALRGIDLDVGSGEWLTLVGPNGAGKSSVLRAICRLLPFKGEISIEGHSVRMLGGAQIARQVAMVPQSPHMPVGMKVSHYLMLGRSPYLGYLGRESPGDVSVVADVLDRLSLGRFADRNLEELSGGERQRVAIGRALAQQSPLLLVDEPTSSLDVARQQEVLDLIDGLRSDRGLTVVAAMHDLTLAGQYADRLALLVEGRVVMSGAPHEVLDEATIASHYGATVRVLEHDGGGRAVVPVRRR